MGFAEITRDRERSQVVSRRGIRARRIWKALAGGITVIGVVACVSGAAFGAGQLTVTPSSSLTGSQVVAVTGSGLASSSKGWILECNAAPGEGTLTLSSPFLGVTLNVGCTAPSLKRIITVNSDGTLSSSFGVVVNRTLGPPCGPYPAIAPCPSNYHSEKSNAAFNPSNYPCPPTPAQQAAGVKCELVLVDSGGDHLTSAISFAGGGPPIPTTTTTPPKSTSTTLSKSTTTTTTPGKSTATTSQAVVTSSNSGGSNTSTGASSGGGSSSVTSPPVAASSSQLAYTGAGPGLSVLFLIGVALTALGLALWLVLLRWTWVPVLIGRPRSSRP